MSKPNPARRLARIRDVRDQLELIVEENEVRGPRLSTLGAAYKVLADLEVKILDLVDELDARDLLDGAYERSAGDLPSPTPGGG